MKSVTQKKNIFFEKMQNLFLRLALKPYFAELIFAILGQNHKNKFQNSSFHNNL